MRKLLFILISLFLIACKKTETPVDLRIKTIKYSQNDTLIGQIDFQYSQETNLLEMETEYFRNKYTRHHYIFENDSIEVDEASYNGTDSAYNTYIVNISGTQHLVTRIRKQGARYDYTYDSNNHLANIDFNGDGKSYNFSFSGDVTSFDYYKGSFIPIPDTVNMVLSYTSRAYQRSINYIPLIEDDNLSNPVFPLENTLNVELAGATFNLFDHLVANQSLNGLHGGNVYSIDYSYTFDNLGRVTTRSYTAPFNPLATIKVEFIYF